MNRLFLFLKKIYVLLLFIVLEVAAINYYASSSSYTKAKILTLSNRIIGGIHNGLSSVGDYFGLRAENDMLLSRLASLHNEVDSLRKIASVATDMPLPGGEAGDYTYAAASVISNSVMRQQNYIMIDKGADDGLHPEMALITAEGTIVGYILRVSNKFSYAISVLNSDFHTGGRFKGKDYFGSISWDGRDPRYVTLSEIPKYAEIEVGDTIVTGYSSIFPPDVLIGTVEHFELDASTYYNNARIRLATDMSGLKRLFVVNYSDMQERLLLEEDSL